MMNERIKELYEQAHIERRQEYFSSVVDPTIKSVSVTRHFDLDLFAELIVRECMSLCTDVEEDVELADYVGGFRDGALMCREDIKKHFGVEE